VISYGPAFFERRSDDTSPRVFGSEGGAVGTKDGVDVRGGEGEVVVGGEDGGVGESDVLNSSQRSENNPSGETEERRSSPGSSARRW